MSLEYVIVTPARNEADNLPRLADSVLAQTLRPDRWIIIENGSTDDTLAIAERLSEAHPWISVLQTSGAAAPERGGAIVRALNSAIEALDPLPEILVNVDADISFEPDYFARLIGAFEADPRLGIASGSAFEMHGGTWKQQHMTRGCVWGASRAYRRECLQAVVPFEPRVGWDGLDELRANSRGWTTRTFTDLPFLHHRLEGERDGARTRRWAVQGELSHYMGYRPSYFVIRVLFQALKDPAALAMLSGYAKATLRREPRWSDERARAYLRSQQQWRKLPLTARQALGRAARPIRDSVEQS
jgi:biofilm PGA synthesis N-glycosyltransferase PgaC